jgi:16S rRNA (uracil1498-N3)-methyltransferase
LVFGVESFVADRFYCPDPPAHGQLALKGDEAHHLARVRRVNVNDVVELFDGNGMVYLAEVREVGKDAARLTIREALRAAPEACELTLATAVPKGVRFDWLVEKATELGVARFVPLITERSVVDPRSQKLDRVRRLVIEAAKQCGRSYLMDVVPAFTLAEYFAQETAPIRLICHPGGRVAREWPVAHVGARAAVAIGPEGGFSPAEIESATAAGWLRIGLGVTRLRIETAGLVASAIIMALAANRSADDEF